ncbi:MAG: hypothetical protein ACUVS1_01525 [Actinomycetota bacterium]
MLCRRGYDSARVSEKLVEAVERNRGVVPLCWEVHLGHFLHRLSRGLYGSLLALLARAWFRGLEGQETDLPFSGSGEAGRDQVPAR